MGEEHTKHFYLYTPNLNFYFYLDLYLGQAQEKQAYLICNVLHKCDHCARNDQFFFYNITPTTLPKNVKILSNLLLKFL